MTIVRHISLLIIKIILLILFGCGVKIHKINPIFGYRVKIPPDINHIYIWFDGLFLMTPKGITIVCGTYVIGHNFINVIYECGVK